MRPIVVLILVLGAVSALLFALTSITGGDGRGGEVEPLTVVKPTDARSRPAASLVEPIVPPARTEPAVEESRQALPEAAEARGAFAGAIEGEIVDEADNPIAEARVSLVNARPNSFGPAFYAMRNQDPPRPASKVVTDETGRFRFERLDPRKDWMVVITHDRYMREEHGIPVPEQAVRKEKFILRPGITCSGTVRDGVTGQPIAEVLLAVDSPLAAFNKRRSASRIEARTDPSGRYTFYNVSPGQQTLTISAPHYATQVHNNFSLVNQGDAPTTFKNRQGGAELESKEQDFELQPGKIIAGRVVSPEHDGVPGIEVEAISQSGTIGSSGIATSAGNGEFLVEGLAEGLYTVRVNAPGYETQTEQRVEAGETNLIITLFEQATVLGRVVDASGRPLESFTCKVRAVNEVSNAYGAMVAQKAFHGAQNGAFEIPGVPEGTYVVEGIASGYASSFSEPFTAIQGLVTADVVVRMSKGGSLRGRIVDSYSGDPIAGAEVKTVDNMWVDEDLFQLFGELEPSALTKATMRTDADGRFEIAVMTPGDYQVQVKARSYTPVFLNDVHIVEGQRTDLPTQTLSKGAVIRGVVYGKDRRVAPGASIMLTPVDNSLLWMNRTVRADATGSYQIENAQAGTYKLAASRPNQNNASPFEAVIDMKQSEIEITVQDSGEYEFDLFMGGAQER